MRNNSIKLAVPTERRTLQHVVTEFKRKGILLESDPDLPNVATLVAREKIKGSWWGHKDGKVIWRVLKRFCAREDVLVTKLVSTKITFVHRRLWPEVMAICTSKESWQTISLSKEARHLLRLVEEKGQIRTDKIRQPSAYQQTVQDTARELERKLLVHSEEIHTERGTHAKVLRSWENWSSRAKFVEALPELGAAKAKLEKTLFSLNKKYRGKGRLPWLA